VVERAALVAGDPRTLPFRDSSFDVVVSRGRLEGLRSPDSFREALLEIIRVLRPGGQLGLVVTEPSSMPSYGEILDAEGFESQIHSAPGLASATLVISRKAAPTPSIAGP
jgi:ubiquinone/menaquinone biosynthesis C-methylase UbiE